MSLTADGHHRWTEQCNLELEDVFAIQEEIAHSIACALKIKLSKKEHKNIYVFRNQNMSSGL